jgi:hypothetical protein
VQCLMLLLLGELGRIADLSAFPEVERFIVGALSEGQEDVKATASLALGGVAVGNVSQHLPLLLSRIAELDRTSPKQLYLLLKSLNEVLRTLLARRTPMPAGAPAALLHRPDCGCSALPIQPPPVHVVCLAISSCNFALTCLCQPCMQLHADCGSPVQRSRSRCCSCCRSACMCRMSAARCSRTAWRSSRSCHQARWQRGCSSKRTASQHPRAEWRLRQSST